MDKFCAARLGFQACREPAARRRCAGAVSCQGGLSSEDTCRGFTLLELLVCVGIIAILAGLLLPALHGASSRGHAMACLNEARQMSLACALYADDFHDTYPYNLGESEIRVTVAAQSYLNWNSSIMSWELDADNTNEVLLTRGGLGPYIRNAEIYRCPRDRVLSDIQAAAGWSRRTRSFSMNAMVGNAGEFSKTGENVNNPSYRQFFRTTHVPRPSDIFVFVEEHPDSVNDGYFLNRAYSRQWMDLPASYHRGAANLTFADGHGETRSWRSASTKPAAKPDAARLPFRIPPMELADYDWLMSRTSVHEDYAGAR
jgi:prepilin-type N-terminal cleavage/methylation domain-containing protein/prepilin-type processing-associated H-X9-DG protein